jgi:hypothetical protein
MFLIFFYLSLFNNTFDALKRLIIFDVIALSTRFVFHTMIPQATQLRVNSHLVLMCPFNSLQTCDSTRGAPIVAQGRD